MYFEVPKGPCSEAKHASTPKTPMLRPVSLYSIQSHMCKMKLPNSESQVDRLQGMIWRPESQATL